MTDFRYPKAFAWGQICMLGLLLVLLAGFSSGLNPVNVWISFGLLVVYHLVSNTLIGDRPYASSWHAFLHLGCYLLLCGLLLRATTRPDEESLFWFISLLPIVTAASRLNLTGTTLAAATAGLLYFLTLPAGFIQSGDFWEELPEFVLIAATYLFVGFLVQALSSQTRRQLVQQRALNQQLLEQKNKLKKTLDQLADAKQQLYRRERLAALGEMSAGMAHEIRNPLGVISSTSQLLLDKLNRGESPGRELLEVIQEESDRLNRLVSDFLVFGRDARPNKKPCNLATLVRRSADGFRPLAEQKSVAIALALKEVATALVDPEMLQQVLLNLLLNALQASTAGQEIRLELDQDKGGPVIRVIDRGTGIPADIADKVFNPFFTTRNEGTGLGLANAHKLVEAQGGHLDFVSQPGCGTTFTIHLPGEPDATAHPDR